MNYSEEAKRTLRSALPIFIGVLAAILVAQQFD